MEERSEVDHAVVKSVLIVAGIFLGTEIAVAAVSYLSGITLPSSVGVVVTVVSTMAGVRWFRHKYERPMSNPERLGFATGVTVVNCIIPVGLLSVLMAIAGLPINADSFDLVITGGHGYLFQPFVAWLALFILGLVFLQAYFVAWFLTRERAR
jgi:hypothetical protein